MDTSPAGEEERTGGWTGLIGFLAQGLDHHAEQPVYVRVVSGRVWSAHRVLRCLPVAAVAVDRGTWEVRLVLPGLLRSNPIGEKSLLLRQLLEQLRSAAEVAGGFTLVLSDEMLLDRAGLIALGTKRGYEWTGPPLDELEEGEYLGKYDLPPHELRVRPRRCTLELLVKVCA